MIRYNLIFIFLFCISNTLVAQVDSVFIKAKSLNGEWFKPYGGNYDLFHQYHPINRTNNFYSSRGNYGAAVKSLLWQNVNTITQNFTFQEYSPYLYNTDSLLYFDTKRAYTNLYWLNGLKKEQHIKLIHTQNITKQFNVAIDFMRYRNNGYFIQHLANNSHLSLSSRYFTKNEKYILHAGAVYNRIKGNENGGVDSASFKRLLFVDKRSLAPQLADASRSNSQWSFVLNQMIYLLKSSNIGDSNKNYSPLNVYINVVNRYTRNKQQYTDNNPSNFYPVLLSDSLRILDSNFVNDLKNEALLGFSLRLNSDTNHSNFIKLETGLGNQQASIYFLQRQQNEKYIHEVYNTTLSNTYWNSNLTFDFNNFFVSANYANTLSGYNGGNHQVQFNTAYVFRKNKLSFNWQNSATRPQFFENTFIGNTHQWDTYNLMTRVNTIEFTYSSLKIPVNISFFKHRIQNYMYYPNAFSIRQLIDSVINNQGIKLNFHITLKKFNWYSWIIAQQNNLPTIISLPQFMVRNTLFFKFYLFKKALPLNVGIEHTYITPHLGYAYAPSIYKFYRTNDFVTGNYHYLDFMLSSQIGQAQIFFKIEHFASGFLGNNYYLIKNSPLADRAFKIGITWYMYN